MEQDYYRILGVDPNTPEREIKRAYYALATKLHPDKAKDPETRRKNEQELALVSAAYNALKDPAKRQEYDARRKEKPSDGVPKNGGGAGAPAASRTASTSTATPNPSRAKPASGGAAAASAKVKGQDLTANRVSIAERAFAKGMQLFNTQNFAEAVPFFDAAIQNDDTKVIYHLKLAIALIRSRGSYTRAVEHAQRAIESDPYNVEHKMVMADIHETAGAVTAARKMYEEVLKWEPGNATAKMRLDLLKSKGKSGGNFLSNLFKKMTKK